MVNYLNLVRKLNFIQRILYRMITKGTNMKKHLLKTLITLLIIIGVKPAFAGEESHAVKRVNPFTIQKRTIDTSLTEGTSKILVTFYGSDGGKYTQPVQIGMNDESLYATPDITGSVTLQVKKGKSKLYFYISGHEEVITDSIKINDQEIIEATVRFYRIIRNATVKKPVIYVYPDEAKDVKIQLDINGKLGFTWPVYHESWDFTASPDGTISMDGKEYNYLFWESEMPEYALDKLDQSGFLVSSDTLLSFLENSLDQMGFTSKEAADFITFWYPQMAVNEKNHVQLLFNESCDVYAKLNIIPQPDQVYRVGIIWKNATTDFIPEPQIIPAIDRNGFVVIEWGGMETDLLFNNEN